MKDTIKLDLATVLSITTGYNLVDDFGIIRNTMEQILDTKLTDNGMIEMRLVTANHILNHYPQLEGLRINPKAIDSCLEMYKQIYGDEFYLTSINNRTKRKKLGKI